jgi:phosphoglycolate phosphatase-like HAD superfamily hydrolase
MQIVLFDVDSTLLTTGGAGKSALMRSLAQVYGPVEPPPGYSLAGKTDPAVLSEVLAAAGVKDGRVQKLVEQALQVYPAILEEELAQSKTQPCPGVPGLLTALSETPEVELGLFTGNLRAGTLAKLRAAGLDGFAWRWFACGDGLPDKTQVLARGLAEMRAERPGLDAGQVLVVGDAEGDVQGGKLHGAHVLGAATGALSPAELLALGADHAVNDLSDTPGLMRWILSASMP